MRVADAGVFVDLVKPVREQDLVPRSTRRRPMKVIADAVAATLG